MNNNATNIAINSSLGSITKPFQPSFCAKLSVDLLNAIGSGATITIPFDTLYFGTNFDVGTFTFIAPKTGIYIFGSTVTCANVLPNLYTTISLVTTTNTYTSGLLLASNMRTATGYLTSSFLLTVPMTLGNSASVSILGESAPNTVTIVSGADSTFWGYLIA